MVELGKKEFLDRREVVESLLAERENCLVVSGLGSPTYDVHAAGDRDENFYLWGGMGGASMIGLGLAIAQPQKTIIVITGDGEQLMGIGSLSTIGILKPKNSSTKTQTTNLINNPIIFTKYLEMITRWGFEPGIFKRKSGISILIKLVAVC